MTFSQIHLLKNLQEKWKTNKYNIKCNMRIHLSTVNCLKYYIFLDKTLINLKCVSDDISLINLKVPRLKRGITRVTFLENG